MAYTARTGRLVNQIRADIAAVTDQQTRDMVTAWAAAWNEVAPDLNAALLDQLTAGSNITRASLLRSRRLSKALLVIAEHLETLSASARVRIIGDLRDVIDIAGGAQASVIDSQLPAGADLVDLDAWSRVDARGVESIVKRSTQRITSLTRPLSRDAGRAVRAELVRGYIAGANPERTAGRIVARAQGAFNGGLTRAMAIARTETLDASRLAAALGRRQHDDILSGWQWHCDPGARTCPACLAKDGDLHPLGEGGPNDHPNGRCVAIPITKSWADLGIDQDEPADDRQTGAEWFEAQDASLQRQILGASRYEAWKAGDYPVSAWGHTVQNAGWRPSLQTTRVPAAYRGGRTPGSSVAS